MSRLYDTVEPSVIDDDMLQQAVEAAGPKDEAGRIAKTEGIDFDSVPALRLDFKNILRIDNLWCFHKLVKLQLDNNIIEAIEGLDHLVNLEWLDLSFNNIEEISGLDSLTKLQDLSLYNNRIERLENLEFNNSLHVLSVGNNRLADLNHTASYLRKFQNIRTLNIVGNPLTETDDYRVYFSAFVPQLVYLDYRLLDEQMKCVAQQKYQGAVEELQHDERAEQRKAEASAADAVEVEQHQAAFVEFMNTAQLFESLFAEDSEGLKINKMPGTEELISVFRERFCEVCQQMFSFGLQAHTKRKAEVDEFWSCVMEFKDENNKSGKQAIDTFLEYKESLFEEMQTETDQKALETRVNEYNHEVAKLWDTLMGYEMALVDQLEEMIRDFERSVQDLVGAFIENIQALTSSLRELENAHHERMSELAVSTLEKSLKNELDADIPDNLRDLLVDKDTIINAVTSSHDYHQLKIDNKEDDMVTRVKTWEKTLIDGLHEEEEVARNRKRVVEITNLIDHLRDEIEVIDVGNPLN